MDVGGGPFSPDAADVGVTEEVDRVLPVVAAVAERSDVVLSVDTFRAEVARRSLAAGASVVNDTTPAPEAIPGLRDALQREQQTETALADVPLPAPVKK